MDYMREFLGEPKVIKEPESYFEDWTFLRDIIEDIDYDDMGFAIYKYVTDRFPQAPPMQQFNIACEISDRLEEIGYEPCIDFKLYN